MADETTRAKSKTTGKKTVHWHGCITCPSAYEDNCSDTTTDGRCALCRGGRGFDLLINNRKPADCCRTDARLVTKEEKTTYRLAGARIWFRCRTCARTHPFDPKKGT